MRMLFLQTAAVGCATVLATTLAGCSGPIAPAPASVPSASASSASAHVVRPPQSEGRIAFVQPRHDVAFTAQILTVAPDGSGETKLDTGLLSAAYPSWSPDGTKIAFQGRERSSNTGIYVSASDGAKPPRRITATGGNASEPDWSPDGTKIAFTCGRSFASEICVMNANGTHRVQLTHNNALDEDPDWSPDGTKITFTSGRDKNFEIYAMDADGRNAVRLTHTHAQVPDVSPAWSPDGNRIAWSSESSGNAEIWVMRADGSDPKQLTHDPHVDTGPTWSAGGDWLAFTSERTGVSQIWTMASNGSDLAQLTPDRGPLPSFGAAWWPVRTPAAANSH